MSNENDTKAKNGPSYDALSAKEVGEGKSYFTRVGAAFPHKDGKGHTINLDAMPVNGRIVLRTPKERLAQAKNGADKPAHEQEQER